MKKFLTVTLAGVLALGTLSGCGGKKPSIDETKTQLYVGFVNGGLGEEWMHSVIARFEDKYKDVPFESGKMGVEIVPHGSKTDYDARKLVGKIGTNGQDVMFVESFYPYELEGDLLEVTDMVTGKLTEFGENKSIEDKMTAEFINAHKDSNGKYYAIPWYEGYYGIMYDVDLFDKEKLYFALNSDDFISDLSEAKSYGPNGKTGVGENGQDYSYDDGLPTTYEQFFILCDEIVSRGLIPCIWSGLQVDETNKTIMGLHVDYEGKANATLNVTFKGTAENLITVSENGTITKREDVEITPANGYELGNQAGRYYAYKFADQLVSNPDYYHWLSFSKSNTHTGAQEEFIYSSHSSKKTPIAMIFDGVWWENESDDIFESMVNGGYGQSVARKNRRFAFMPFPKATEDKVGENLTVANINSAIIINGAIADYKVDLAKKFVQFCHTDESMSEFSRITSMMKPYDYVMKQADLDNMTYFGKSLANVHNTADKVFLGSSSRLYQHYQGHFTLYDTYKTYINNLPYTTPFSTFKDEKISAAEYFNRSLKDYTQTGWTEKYSMYFND